MSRTLPLVPPVLGWGGGGFAVGLPGTTTVFVGLVADADALAATLPVGALGVAEVVGVAVFDAGSGGCVMAWRLDA